MALRHDGIPDEIRAASGGVSLLHRQGKKRRSDQPDAPSHEKG
jgi:hypothetical protein